MRNRSDRGFIGVNLIEILIVLVVIGILAGIVVPKFLDSALGASNVNVKIQLNTIRTQLEMYRLHSGGRLPDLLRRQWTDLVSENMLSAAPRNPFQQDSSVIAAEPGAGVGWVWDGSQIYAVSADGRTVIQ